MMAESPIESLIDVANTFKDDYKEIRRDQRLDLVDRPLQGKKRSRREQELRYEVFRTDPLLIASEVQFLTQRFSLTKDKPVPRRLIDHFLRGERRRKGRG